VKGYYEDEVVAVHERYHNGQRYKVTIIEVRSVPPWGTEPCCFDIAKWELLGPVQPTLFDV